VAANSQILKDFTFHPQGRFLLCDKIVSLLLGEPVPTDTNNIGLREPSNGTLLLLIVPHSHRGRLLLRITTSAFSRGPEKLTGVSYQMCKKLGRQQKLFPPNGLFIWFVLEDKYFLLSTLNSPLHLVHRVD
jgi:hypothetical protein